MMENPMKITENEHFRQTQKYSDIAYYSILDLLDNVNFNLMLDPYLSNVDLFSHHINQAHRKYTKKHEENVASISKKYVPKKSTTSLGSQNQAF